MQRHFVFAKNNHTKFRSHYAIVTLCVVSKFCRRLILWHVNVCTFVSMYVYVLTVFEWSILDQMFFKMSSNECATYE